MTVEVIPRPVHYADRWSMLDDLRSDPDLKGRLLRADEDHLEGRVVPWSQVKKELGI